MISHDFNKHKQGRLQLRLHMYTQITSCNGVPIWISQNTPLNIEVHWHVKESTPSMHVAPFWHEFHSQSSIFCSHLSPVKPVLHVQVTVLGPSRHTPPFWQGELAQLSTSVDWKKIKTERWYTNQLFEMHYPAQEITTTECVTVIA